MVGARIRRLTEIECERLQGFPDNWTKFGTNEKGETITISRTQRYKMCGNAVTVAVVEMIGQRLIKL
jgi:DNA (cytosine-5)-methyltransferase 1